MGHYMSMSEDNSDDRLFWLTLEFRTTKVLRQDVATADSPSLFQSSIEVDHEFDRSSNVGGQLGRSINADCQI